MWETGFRPCVITSAWLNKQFSLIGAGGLAFAKRPSSGDSWGFKQCPSSQWEHINPAACKRRGRPTGATDSLVTKRKVKLHQQRKVLEMHPYPAGVWIRNRGNTLCLCRKQVFSVQKKWKMSDAWLIGCCLSPCGSLSARMRVARAFVLKCKFQRVFSL